MATFYNLQIQQVIKETANAVSLVFEIPANLKKTFSFKAGQYITLKANINGEEIRRAYSICSSPKSGVVKVTVKAVKNGTFSKFATTSLKAGDVLEVATPEGKFMLEPKPNKNYLGFAAGSGITPVLSMIKTVLETETSSTFTLIYGNKTAEDTIFYAELNELMTQYPQQFNVHYIFSSIPQPNCLFGRIDKGNTNFYIKNKYKNLTFSEVFLCGPEKMIELVSETLQEHKIAKENIHFELFTASVSEENTAKISEGKAEITVLLDDEETTFTMDKKEDILAASLRKKLDPPYSCQGGVCSSCLAKVTEGKAVMTKNTILTDDEVKDGFVLTCQAHPTTQKITINFDDV